MVDKKEIFQKIGGILTELNDQYQYLSKSKDKFNELEMELFSANAKFLADHIGIIQKLNKAESVEEEPARESKKEKEVVAAVPVKEIEPEKPVKDVFAPQDEEESPEKAEGQPKEEIKSHKQSIKEFFKLDKTVKEDDNAGEVEAEKEKPGTPEPETQDEVIKKEVIIRERTISVDVPPAEKKPTVNDIISAQRDQSTLATKYNTESVTDLKTIISLNDKLLFVKDLFNGYSLAYSEAIELLNRFDNFNSADNFLKTNYSGKNNWATKQETVDKFYEMINRRFAK